jgi:MSHA biogenesis protein MshN
VTQQALVAASYQRLDEHENAVKHYQLALAQDANDARNWIGLGISQENTAALEDALNSYRRAVELGGLNSRLRAFVAARSSTLEQVLN